MKIVIDIPKEHYEHIQNLPHYKTNYEQDLILDGTPLPKNHGRLIDADELAECMEIMDTISGESKYAIRMDDIRNAPTIIEAESEEE